MLKRKNALSQLMTLMTVAGMGLGSGPYGHEYVDHGYMPRQDEIDHKKVTPGDRQVRRQRKAKKKEAKVRAQQRAEKLARELRLKQKAGKHK